MAGMSARRVKTDRSRIATYQKCPRKRWLHYHAGEEGLGYERVSLSLPLAAGQFFHSVAAVVLKGGDPALAIADAIATFRSDVAARGIEGVYSAEEEAYMLEALAWMWVKRRLPAILDEYDVVETEKEYLWPIGDGIDVMVRCDCLLRRKADKALFLLEFKTTRAFTPLWASQWNFNSQINSNLQAMEEIKGERVEGVIIEGLLKSPMLARYWVKPDGTISLKGHRGWELHEAKELGAPKEWAEHPIWTDMDRDSLFNTLMPKRPVTAQLQRWRRQTVAQEDHIAGAVLMVRGLSGEPELQQAALDAGFPMYDDACMTYGHPCDFMDICYKEEVRLDPVGSGLYMVRVPHHAPEGLTPPPVPDKI